MLDFEKIAEISFFVNELDQIIVLENGLVVSKENLSEFLMNSFDA